MTNLTNQIERCVATWRSLGLTDSAVSDMKKELEAHLHEAKLAGKLPADVIGSDLEGFARSWAVASSDGLATNKLTSPSPRQIKKAEHANQSKTRLLYALIAIVFVTAITYVIAPREELYSLEWQWGFLIAACVLIVGEVLTGGFFVLPFAIGAISGFILSLDDVHESWLIAAFFIVSLIGLVGLRELANTDDDKLAKVGATRYTDATGVLLDEIAGPQSNGRVKIGSEEWLAISNAGQHIPAGALVRVTEVRGVKMVVSDN